MYHGVTKVRNNIYNARHTYIEDFERQIHYLSKNSKLVSVKDFFLAEDKKGLVAITFDDGFKNNYTLAAPILKKYNVPASMYITGLNNSDYPFIWADFLQICSRYTSKSIILNGEKYIICHYSYTREKDGVKLIDVIKYENPNYNFKIDLYNELIDVFKTVKDETRELWELMSDEDIKNLSLNYPNISIGSHGFYHNNLGGLDLKDSVHELNLSKSYLESLIQKEVNELGYPDGSYTEGLYREALGLGFTIQLAAGGSMLDSHKSEKNINDRFGIYQFGSWASQIIC